VSEESAAARYKEITAIATTAAKRLRRHEMDKIARLEDEVAAYRERTEAADAEHEKVVEAVRLRWDEAMEELWNERWMRVTQMPSADTSAAPAKAADAIRMVQTAYLELRGALRQSRWQAASWIPRRGSRQDS
jgi:hypothetical protein